MFRGLRVVLFGSRDFHRKLLRVLECGGATVFCVDAGAGHSRRKRPR